MPNRSLLEAACRCVAPPSRRINSPALRSSSWLWLLLALGLCCPNSPALAQTISIPIAQVNQSARVAGGLTRVQLDPAQAAKIAPVMDYVLELYHRTGQMPAQDQVVQLQQQYLAQLQASADTYRSVKDPWSNPITSSSLDLLGKAVALVPGLGGPGVGIVLGGIKLKTQIDIQNDPIYQGLQTQIGQLQGSLDAFKSPENFLYYQNLLQQSDDLAQSNPEFRLIHETILSSFTGIKPTDQAADVLAEVPELANSAPLQAMVAQPVVNGQITLGKDQLTALFQDQLHGLYASMDTNRNMLLQISSTQSNILDYLQDQASQTAAANAQAAARAQTAAVIDSANASIYLLSTAIGLSDPVLGHQVDVVGKSAVQIASALNKFDAADLANTLVNSATIAGAAMEVLGLFGGGASADQVILKQIGQLQTQISNLQAVMLQRFDQIDKSLNVIYGTLERGLAQLNQNETQIRASLFTLQEDLHVFERSSYDQLISGFSQFLTADINQNLGYQATYGQPMTYSQYQNSENDFYTWAHDNAGDSLRSPTSAGTEAALAFAVNTYPLTSRLNALNAALPGVLGVAAMAPPGTTLANPRVWAIGAESYVQLARENPAYFRQISTNRLANIASIGQQLQSSINSLTFLGAQSSPRINWPLWNAAFDYYRAKIAIFSNSLAQSLTAYHLQHSDLDGVDILHETNYFELIAGSYRDTDGSSIPADGNGSSAYINPPQGPWGIPRAMPDGSMLFLDIPTAISRGTNYVRRVTPTGAVTIIAAISTRPTVDGKPWTNNLNSDFYLDGYAVAPNGQFFVTYSLYNSAGARSRMPVVLKAETNGALTTIAGNLGVNAIIDGQGTNAGFAIPVLEAVTANGDIYVSEFFSGSNIVRKIDLQGNVTTLGAWDVLPIPVSDFVVDSDGSCCFWGIDIGTGTSPLPLRKFRNGVLSNLPGAAGFGYTWSLAGAGNSLWMSLGQVAAGTTVFFGRFDLDSATLQPLWSAPQGTYNRPEASGTGATAWLGDLLGSLICVDPWQNVYLYANGDYVVNPQPPQRGGFIFRLGGRRSSQLGVFQQFSSDLHTSGALQAAAQNLDVAKELLVDLISLSLSQSLESDDAMRSLLNGNAALLDTPTIMTLVSNTMTALNVAPVRPLVDLPAVASARLDALERQVKSHLLEIDSASRPLNDSLVLHLTLSNNAAHDDSPSAHSVGLLGPLAATSGGMVSPQSLAGANVLLPDANPAILTVTNGLTVSSTNDFLFSPTADFTIAFWALPDSETGSSRGVARPEPLFIGTSNTLNAGWWAGLDSAGAFHCEFTPAGSATISYSFAPPESGWMHCAVVFARSAGVIRCFVNGVNVAQLPLDPGAGNLGSTNLVIGGGVSTNLVYSTHGPGSFTVNQSLLNELSIWRRAVGSAEIQALYNRGLSGLGLNLTAPAFPGVANPTEPLHIVQGALDDLALLQTFRRSPVPDPILAMFPPATPTNALQITVYGEPGRNYAIQSSPTFGSSAVWQTVSTNLDANPLPLTAFHSGNRFFRAKPSQ